MSTKMQTIIINNILINCKFINSEVGQWIRLNIHKLRKNKYILTTNHKH